MCRSNLTSSDLFEYLDFEPTRHWCSLLFMDKFNYGGLELTDSAQRGEVPPRSSELEDMDEAGQEKADGKPNIFSDWNIAEFLPEKLKVGAWPSLANGLDETITRCCKLFVYN